MYRRETFFIFCLALLSCVIAEKPTPKRGYIFTAPKRLVAGEKAKVCLSLYNLEPPVHVNVDLFASPSPADNNTGSEDIFATTEATIKDEVDTCLELQVPANTNYSEANLRLSLKFDKHPDYVVRAQRQVSIEHDMLVTFVETDKPIYKPGQNVNIRILNLKPDLKPWTKPIPKVWIENPAEVRVAQWTDVKTENGMAQLSFPLSDESNSGDWKIVVEKTKPEYTQTSRFEVREYVLPRFQVTIESPKYILAYDTNATWKVCAKYSYGEPVKGLLVLTLKPETPFWVQGRKNEETKYEAKINTGSDGCINYTANAKELGLTHRYTPNSIDAQVNFTEAKTGINETATSTTSIKTQPLTIEIYEHIPRYFKPGLPFYGKLRVLRADYSTPAPNENIEICLSLRRYSEWYQEKAECRNFTSSDPDGFVDFSVAPQNTSIDLLSFSATAVDYPTDYDLQRYIPSGYADAESWYSNSSSYIQVTKGSSQPIVCGQKYSFNVTYTSPGLEDSEAIDFYYSINSRGNILESGHIKEKPRKESRLDDSEFLGENVLGAKKSDIATKESSSDKPYVYRFPLSINVTPNMAPKSELLLYYIRPDGEVVSTTQSIKIDQCFENPVKLTWQEEKMQPGSMAKLQVEAAPDSLCGVSAVDKSTRFLKTDSGDSHLLQPETVSARLKTLDQSNGYIYRPNGWTGCDQRSVNHSMVDGFYSGYNPYVDVNAVKDFDDSGKVIMSDLILCPSARPDKKRSFSPYYPMHGAVPQAAFAEASALGSGGMAAAPPPPPPSASFARPALADRVEKVTVQLSTPTIIRSYFPETWIWELIPTGSQGKTVIERKLPDTITDWIGNVVCLSSDKGLGIGAPSQITAFQPFFLDYILPYSVRRGEQLHLKVSLFNYMSHSLPVIIKLLDHEGLDLASNLTETTFCVQPKDSVVHEFLLIPTKLGELNVSVAAEINVDPKKTQDCSLENQSYVRDQIIKPVLVKAEGFPVEISKSAFLCPKDFSNDSSLEWELELPKPEKSNEKVVDGSVKAHVSVIGDILGPALDNLENLIQLPMGCGEQNMILFVPNIHAIAYLDAAKRPTTAETRKNALNNMRKGYQRELNYRHSDGSYSAFGSSDKEGSMWLTAFVIKSFSQARKMIEIDERDLKMSVDWITNRQLENGCFPVVGQVFHKDMKGGLTEETGSSSTLTAYVLIALLESKVPLPASVTDKALQCLENSNSSSDSSTSNLYGEALKSYALALLEHPKAKESLQAFMSRASQQNERLWWEDKNRPDSLSLSIETTAYGVLSLLKLGGEANTVEAFKAVRWLSSKRNPQGGFSSTQDTVLGLEAITKYALTMNNGKATDLTVSVTASDMKQNYKIDEVNRMVLQSSRLPSLPTKVEVSAKGEGCLLVQSSLKYNKVNSTKSDAFEVSVNVDTNSADSSNSVYSQSEDACSVQRLTICSRYKLPDGESNMALLEVGMVTGFVPDRSSLQELLKDPSNGVKRFEINQDTVVIYFEKLTSQNSCISFQAIRENVVDNAKPGNIKLYDYYQQEHSISKNYKFTEVCKKEN